MLLFAPGSDPAFQFAPGRVKIARHEDTHQYAAVKIVPKPRPTTTNPAAKADKVRKNGSRRI